MAGKENQLKTTYAHWLLLILILTNYFRVLKYKNLFHIEHQRIIYFRRRHAEPCLMALLENLEFILAVKQIKYTQEHDILT